MFLTNQAGPPCEVGVGFLAGWAVAGGLVVPARIPGKGDKQWCRDRRVAVQPASKVGDARDWFVVGRCSLVQLRARSVVRIAQPPVLSIVSESGSSLIRSIVVELLSRFFSHLLKSISRYGS